MKAIVIKTGEIVDVYHEPQHGQVTNIYKESVLVNGRMWSEDELDFCVKANEAPEKIYLGRKQRPDKEIFYVFTTPVENDDIEYVRTDAFIEKAENFFENYLEEEECKFGVSEWVEVRSDFESLDSLIRAFVNYIKGE